MSTKVTVAIRQLEIGQSSPIEGVQCPNYGFTTLNLQDRVYELVMPVEEFNRRARDIFEKDMPPGFKYIPFVRVEVGADPEEPEELKLLRLANPALQEQIDKVTLERDQLSKQLTLLARENSRLTALIDRQANREDSRESAAAVVTPPTSPVPDDAPLPFPWAEKIDEKLAIQAHRLNQLAQALEVLPQDLRAFIESKDSGYSIDPKGAWVKKKEAPAA